MDTHTPQPPSLQAVLASVIEGDLKMAQFLAHAATCLRADCPPMEVADILSRTAEDCRQSAARNSEWLES